jgi:hypothetical protein
MAVAYGASGAIVYSTGNPAAAYPTGITAGQLLILEVRTKPDNTPATTPAGWTLLGAFSGGAGTTGIDVGPTRLGIFVKIADGTETGSVTVTVTGNNVSSAQIHRYTKTLSAWDYDIAGGADTTGGTAFSVVCGTVVAGWIATNDLLHVVNTFPTDTAPTWGTPTLTAQGGGTVTLGAPTVITTASTTSGQDLGGRTVRHTVTASTQAAGTVTYNATLSGTTTNTHGPLAIVRLRDLDVPTAPTSAPPVSAIGEAIFVTAPATYQGGATSYSLYRDGVFDSSGIAAGVGQIRDSDASVTANQTYTWRGVNAAGESPDSPASVPVAADPLPPTFSLIPGSNQVTVGVTQRAYAAQYKVYRGLAGGARSLVHTSTTQAGGGTYSWIDTGVTNNNTYDYHVTTYPQTPTVRESAASTVKSITVGSPKFMAVDGNYITASTDGANWFEFANPGTLTTSAIISIGVSPDLSTIVMGTDGGSIIYSTDGGANFTLVSPTYVSGTFQDQKSVAYNGVDKWVVASQNGQVMYSSDGISWTVIQIDAANLPLFYWVDWVEALSLFIVTGSGGRTYTSPDGINWTNQNFTTLRMVKGVWVESQSLYVLVGDTGNIWTSPDLVNWTNRTAGGPTLSNLNSVTSDGTNVFIAAGTSLYRTTNVTNTSGIYTTQISGSGITSMSHTLYNADATYPYISTAGGGGQYFYSATGTSGWTMLTAPHNFITSYHAISIPAVAPSNIPITASDTLSVKVGDQTGPATFLSHTFENGTNGVAIALSDVLLPGDTTPTSVNTAAATTQTYDGTLAWGGTKSARWSTTDGVGGAYPRWTGVTPSTGTIYGSFAFRGETMPSTLTRLMDARTNAAAYALGIAWNGATNKLRFQGVGPVTIADTTMTFSANTWYEIEFRVVPSASVGQFEYRI